MSRESEISNNLTGWVLDKLHASRDYDTTREL